MLGTMAENFRLVSQNDIQSSVHMEESPLSSRASQSRLRGARKAEHEAKSGRGLNAGP
jgi:hypothetical protein